ncbi:MAG: hypothetical protein B7O98_07740 [Zestosphaera tikiterensis]|uniref:Transcription regulator AsnC/Lrp ligand binding domain-containing protein n=1 Tax=Zestosphaera tikiterensis TaxID=1973259 RepID=A0A2R7Y6N4_9CREN|nr:MAG: hypothetical protein B7O98_07740 [Zestosphaera tikiterensis]
MSVKAYILTVVSLGTEYQIAEEILKLGNEKTKVSVDVVFGEYDLVVIVETTELKEVDRVVTQLRKIPGVQRTSTLITSR